MTIHHRTLCTLALLLVANGALAQVFRQVGPDGRISFSDQPSRAATQPVAEPGNRAGATTSSGGLPYELRQVMQRYPVTIYTSADCAPCDTGRSLLTTRGVPFDERTVKTAQDTAALQRLTGHTSLPVLGIGTQQLKGFQDAEWSQYLDAAGYPKSNQLPAGYRMPPAAPLVAVQVAPTESAERAAPPTPQPPPTLAPRGASPSNPAGIIF